MITTRHPVAAAVRIGGSSRTREVRAGGGPGRRRAGAWRLTPVSSLTLAAALVLLACLAGTAIGRSHHAAADRTPVKGVVAASSVDSGQPAVLAAAATVPLQLTLTGHGDLLAMTVATVALIALIALSATTRLWRDARVRAVGIAPRADRGPPTVTWN